MSDFFRRNLVWIAILLCIAGVVLSIIGIPTSNPIFFFVGIILALPTVGYLIYQIFFYHEKPELNLAPTTTKFSTSNITSIVTNKNDVMLNEISTDEDLEPFYNGFANEQEVNKRLHEITNTERERAIIELPEIDLPAAEPNGEYDNTAAIEDTTNEELTRQRDAASNTPASFTAEIPTELVTKNDNKIEPTTLTDTKQPEPYTVEIENFETVETEPEAETQYIAPSLDAPNFILPTEPVMPQNQTPTNQALTQPDQKLTTVDLTKATVIHMNAENLAKRKQKAQEKKSLLSQINLERYLRRYFIETAACFLMERTLYKDKNGIAPYNKFTINKENNLPEYTMSSTKGRLYKFCTYLIDTERFITHQALYDDFLTAIEQGVSLSRISETLHALYRKKYKKDFVLNLSNREDWDNVMILVYNNYLLSNNNFKDVFTHLPFEIPVAYNDENIVDYLKDPDLQDRFAERYSALEEMGVPTFWEAYYICFINSIKQKLNSTQLETAILREYKKIARTLKRIDASRRKLLKKAS